ncbi:hypothetical protein [Streptomyces sp. Je 1-369]|uniref:hypothetical protein n=1 Tax=Streptomyces sp. Je 1-369 TaxID=2966192 RepID=UPI002286115F|nr:hypothetical protein [Streptomyces sp. Je 1-369]WAL98111.1 hypothetical protein NOO62_28680 [Streptomyces sp. Je 1-369]
MTEDTQRPTSAGTAPHDVRQYGIGTLVIDEARKRLGVVMDRVGGRYQLRSPSGGREWDCAAEFVRTPRPGEIVHVTATAAGQHS